MEVIGRLKGDLKLRCWDCGHRARWTNREAEARLGWGCTVPEARWRLKCSACGTLGRVEFEA
jgi:hypothetical protein